MLKDPRCVLGAPLMWSMASLYFRPGISVQALNGQECTRVYDSLTVESFDGLSNQRQEVVSGSRLLMPSVALLPVRCP
eukprot:2195283-Amphidinium_carterae.1